MVGAGTTFVRASETDAAPGTFRDGPALAARTDWSGTGVRGPSSGGRQDLCTVCSEPLVGGVFTWPGCHLPHRLHTSCLAGMFASLPGWPAEQPGQGVLAHCIRESVQRAQAHERARRGEQAHLACPVCRHPWSDWQAMATTVQQMRQWPARERQLPAPRPLVEQQAPQRPTVPMVLCAGPERSEMEWSTFQRPVRDNQDPMMSRRGVWVGEWQCRARACEGGHTAPAEVTGVPTLWQREPPPHAVLPQCLCASLPLAPVVLHDPRAVGDPWAAQWSCMRCGIWDVSFLGRPAAGVDLELAALCLSPDDWTAACRHGSPNDFWNFVRSRATELVQMSSAGRSYFDAMPPTALVARSNSQVYAPLLLDGVGLLGAEAQAAWRQHSVIQGAWQGWSQQLRNAQPIALGILLTALRAAIEAQPGAPPLNRTVALLWASVLRSGNSDDAVTLADVVQNSRTATGYLPSLVQEVLLTQYGGVVLGQEVALMAAALRVHLAGAAQAAPAASATGVAAARESCDAPVAPPALLRDIGDSEASDDACGLTQEMADVGMNEAAESRVIERVPANQVSAEPVETSGHPGSGSREMDVQEVADAPPQSVENSAVGGRRVRRRTESWRLLECTMCRSADAHQASDSRGLLQHMVRMHVGQPLSAEAVAQLRALGKECCRICGTIRARTSPTCTSPTCRCATATRPLQLGDVIPDRRRGAVTAAGVGRPGDPATAHQQSSQQGQEESDVEMSATASHVVRAAQVSDESTRTAARLRHQTLDEVPVCVAARMATCMAETVEGMIAGDECWGFLARYRSRLLLAMVPEGLDRNDELKRRLRLWEQGRFDELVTEVAAQQLEDARVNRGAMHRNDTEERRGKRARQQAAAGAKSKAVKGLVGGVATSTPEEREQWTADLIPRSVAEHGPLTTEQEKEAARECAWGQGEYRQARKEMREAGKKPGSHAGIPWARLAPWSAPGPSGDRQEHLDGVLKNCGASRRRRLLRAIDELTVKWAVDALPPSCRWLLNTQLLFLRKNREPTCKTFDDAEWLEWLRHEVTRVLGDASGEEGDTDSIMDDDVEAVGPELAPDEDAPMDGSGALTASPPRAVRPIQMGEFLRRLICKRLLLLLNPDVHKVMLEMRQLGVGMPGGAETLATFHQLLYELWEAGELSTPLARVKIDERNCYGSLEWPAVREATRQALPRHFAATCWKHAAASAIEQADMPAAPKDRGAEQGDVDGAMECSVTLGGVASEARGRVHARQRRGELPWFSSGAAEQAVAAEFDERSVRAGAWSATPPAQRRVEHGGVSTITTDPRHEVQTAGGLADWWYLDDGDVLCHPRLVPEYLRHFDEANPQVGGDRNRVKTEVIYYADQATLEAHDVEWQLDAVRELATVETAAAPGTTLGVATGSAASVGAQLHRKVQVIKAMHERVAVIQDVQTENVLSRDCLGTGRVNHILRVHGEELCRDGEALGAFDQARAEELDRLFPGLTAEGHEQATMAPAVGGLGWRRASDSALPANLGALVLAGPKIRAMAGDAVKAGLLRAGQVEERLTARTHRVTEAFLRGLDELERVRAQEFLQKAHAAAEELWTQTARGDGVSVPAAPTAEAGYDSQQGPVQRDGGEGPNEAGRGEGRRLSVPHVQSELTKLQDYTRLRALEATLRRQSNWPQLEALRDLRHPEVSHKWLWHLDTRRGSVLPPCDYVLDVQRRLGACVINSDIACSLCGRTLDPQLVHSECCDTAGATRGHYTMVRAVVEGLRLADSGVTTEPQGLTTTQSRPADILTNAAVPGRSAALDVCIASPNAAGAAGDAAEAAFKRKLRRYRREIPQLAAAGIVYRPLVWTAAGRPHPAVTRTLKFAAVQASTRAEQHADAKALLSRWRHEIQVAIQRRRAAMTRAVLPRSGRRSARLLTGQVSGRPSSEGRLPPLEDEEDDEEDAQREQLEAGGADQDSHIFDAPSE